MNLLSAFCQQLNSSSLFLCFMNAIAATVDDAQFWHAQFWPQYICEIYSALHHSLPPSHPCSTSAEPTSPHMPVAKEFAFPQANLCVCLQLRPADAAEGALEAASHAGTTCFHGSCNQLLEALVCL